MTQRDSQTLNQLRTLKAWHAAHVESGGVVFPTYASLQWFIRTNYQALMQTKVFIPGKGGRATLVTAAFDVTVLELLTLKSKN